ERQCRVELRGVLDLLAVGPHHDTFILDVNLLDEPGRNEQLPAKRHRDTWIDDQIAACSAFDRLNYLPDCAVTRADVEAAKIDSRQRLVAKIPDFCDPHRRPPVRRRTPPSASQSPPPLTLSRFLFLRKLRPIRGGQMRGPPLPATRCVSYFRSGTRGRNLDRKEDLYGRKVV